MLGACAGWWHAAAVAFRKGMLAMGFWDLGWLTIWGTCFVLYLMAPLQVIVDSTAPAFGTLLAEALVS